MTAATRWADTTETRRAETQILADTERLWRDWKAYVREQQSLLAQRMHSTRTKDDLTTPVEGGAVDVVQANVSGPRRREFDETVEKRRRDLQSEMEAAARSGAQPFPDADTVLERLLDLIERELDGKAHPRGYALVWRQGVPFEFDASGVTSVSHDDDYLHLKKQRAVKPHIIVLVAVGSLIGLLLLGWVLVGMLFPAPASSHSSAPRSEPKLSLVGEKENTTFAMLGTDTILLLGREIPGTPAVGYPLFICVPDAAIGALTPGTTVTVSGTDNLRTYTVNAPGDGQPPDFLFGPCKKEGTAIAASASLVNIVTMEHLDPSLLISIAAWLPETSPQTIPSNQALVQMILRGEGVRGSLLVGDGSTTRAPTDVADGEGQTVLSYLVPLEWTEQTAAWRRAEDREGIPRRLIVEIPRAQGRAVWLRDRLHVSNQAATVTELLGDGTVHLDISFTLTAVGDEPLSLIASDLRLSPPADWEPPVLQPGASEDVSLVLQGNLSPPLDIAIGDWNAQISW
jgi:hypothetical protein